MTNRELYLEPNQAGTGHSSDYKTSLGDALEAAFEQGVHDLPALVTALNDAGIHTPDGHSWTTESFTAELASLGG
jgi:hypothetical protein